VMNAGHIVEHGTHTQLLEKKDYYHKLYTMNLF
jgi:ABC-type transport system involved in Fe-S cluster assembly fused permease/ATPase subunit